MSVKFLDHITLSVSCSSVEKRISICRLIIGITNDEYISYTLLLNLHVIIALAIRE